MFPAGREIDEEELQKFCSRVCVLLQNKDYGHETVNSLQRLYFIISATKYSRRTRLPEKVVQMVQSALYFPKSGEQVPVLSAAILREMSPCHHLCELSCDDVNEAKLCSLFSSIILAQGNRNDGIQSLGLRVIKLLESRQPEGQSSRHLLPVLHRVINLNPNVFTEDQTDAISKKLVEWLRYASTQQGMPLSGGIFFTSPRTRQPIPVNEVDGAVAADFFTVLSIGQHYTEDQWMNMHTFSMIRKWLLCYGGEEVNSADTDNPSETDSSVVSMVSATSTSSRLLPPKDRLREKAFEYCLRLIEQSDRKALRKLDSDLQKACLIEAVTVMDVVCRQDSSFVYRAFPYLKALHGRVSRDLSFSRVVLPIAQFFLDHSEIAAVESEAVYRHLFMEIPSELFSDPILAFEFVSFCRENLKILSENVGAFTRSFPNLFKFLAWNSPSLISEFLEVLPALISPESAVEILHSLLDLPCMTAALEIQLRCPPAPLSEKVSSDFSVKPSSSVEAFRYPCYKSMYLYILRSESGTGDTIDRLSLLHEVLLDMASRPRIVQCAQVVPILLQVFFSVVPQFADGVLVNQLVQVLLERSSMLYNIPNFRAEVQRVLSSQLLVLCKLHPSLIVEQSKELLDFCGTISNIHTKENFFTHVVWAIGEYLSVSYDKRCTVEQITKFFETLEALLFEITQLRPSSDVPKYSPRIITVLMTTLCKLASRSQDLIPRVSLFLSKMRMFVQSAAVSSVYSEEDSETILTRANELINLLKLPNIAQFVLAPPAEGASPRYHRDTNASLPLAMGAVSRVLQRGLLQSKAKNG
uniref:Adaptor related protein complex 5 subunit zeta 1 n=1 Tax=Latimeria chalumnae TaxID=7897 RepID=H3AAJ6_LATCH